MKLVGARLGPGFRVKGMWESGAALLLSFPPLSSHAYILYPVDILDDSLVHTRIHPSR